ncbi:hypothetical protein L6452_25369 [Arctium lappa]|uniref:Uncharacterized protein n=1 Tax=Arctium lappa TaxID=4217 RepID=A0ACB9AC91_ARCLA|nr:hypothetical protein L6452_25369 [Arctium lappa]
MRQIKNGFLEKFRDSVTVNTATNLPATFIRHYHCKEKYRVLAFITEAIHRCSNASTHVLHATEFMMFPKLKVCSFKSEIILRLIRLRTYNCSSSLDPSYDAYNHTLSSLFHTIGSEFEIVVGS